MRINNNDPRIDAAINSYPLVELPEGFSTRVINSIRRGYPQVRFRLQFIDLALPLFLSLFSLTVLSVGIWGMNQLDLLRFEYLKLEITHFLKMITPAIGFEVNLVILFTLAILLVGSLFTVWLINRPRKMLRI